MGVSNGFVTQWVKDWKKHLKEKSTDELEMYGITDGNPPSVEEEFLKCFHCRGSYKYFRDAEDSDVKAGHTIQSILDRKYDWKNSNET